MTITDYVQPAQAPVWGSRSYWKQPWRSYLDTVPAQTLLDAVGINFNVSTRQAPYAARLLGQSGFTRARLELGWGSISYDNPREVNATERADFVAKLTALRENGIRPLILLNGNHGRPCPVRAATLSLLAPAAAGATALKLDPATIGVGEIVPGRTGITQARIAAAEFITSVDVDGLAHLSKPLMESLPAGPVDAVTLGYEPFSPPTLPDGSLNPRFRKTMDGWLAYVETVAQLAKNTLGSEEFDLEIWNELSFGSNFLNINTYYEPDPGPKPVVNRIIVEESVRALKDPANGVPNVPIGNGFANQSPHGTGISGTAIDKHPYFNARFFPASKDFQLTRPLNALGEPDGWRDAEGNWHDSFTPTFTSFFPEYSLSALQTESLIHDLAPYESQVGGVLHGRYVTGLDGTGPSPVWVTEVNLAPSYTQKADAQMTAADIRHLESKTILRYLVSFINKGVTALDFYAANAGDLSLVDQQFFEAIKPREAPYPGDAVGGETMTAVNRLTEAMQGAEGIESPRQLTLEKLTDFEGNVQFDGDGTAAHSPLYNREVLAFLPFQVNAHRFVIPTYVMTRNVAQIYDPEAPNTDPTRFDMPSEPYRLTIGRVNGIDAEVSALDPITGTTTPVEVLGEAANQLVVQMQVSDSPRLLVIQEKSSPTEPETPPPAPEEEPPPPEEVLKPGPGSNNGKGNGGPRKETLSSDSVEPDPLSLELTLRNGWTLVRQHRVLVLAECDAVCTIAFRGKLSIGQRQVAMRLSGGKVRGHPNRPTSVRMTIPVSISRALHRALSRGRQVRATVSASAVNSAGVGATSTRSITLDPRARKS